MPEIKDKALLQDVVEKSVKQGWNCSQYTLNHVAKKLGIDENLALNIGAGFGGGMYAGERCGAVTGSLMGLGLLYAKYGKDGVETDEKFQIKKIEFEKRFKEVYGSLGCAEIIGASYGTEEGRKKIKEENLIKDCGILVAYACQIVDELIDED